MTPPSLSWFTALLIALTLAASRLGLARGEETPGLSDSKPESGASVEVDGKFMIPYVEKLPGTDTSFVMIPIPGGEFLIGSPVDEADRSDDEGPQVRVKVEPFWIGRNEVTWAEYHAYMEMYNAFKQLQTLKANRPADESADGGNAKAWSLVESHAWNGDTEADIDAVTSPTPLYVPDHTYMAGDQPDQPAVTMTQYAARQYTKWLSGITGHEYRLPSEAEWEYAARAGTETAYSFGDDPAELERYGWFMDNSDYATHPVGTKEPNAWGLFDVHGNAAEWTLDEYAEDRYQKLSAGLVAAWEAVNWPTEVYPRVIRGGSWLDEPPMGRSAARHKSDDEEWKISDPNLPLSPWWYTEEPAMGVGMRLVRTLKPLSNEDQRRVWEADVEDLKSDVQSRLEEGRGALGVADPLLPEAVKAAEKISDEQ